MCAGSDSNVKIATQTRVAKTKKKQKFDKVGCTLFATNDLKFDLPNGQAEKKQKFCEKNSSYIYVNFCQL